MMHPLLRRQIRKFLGGEPPPGLERLLDAVDAAYEAADEDRRLLERAMELTSDELLARNQELEEANQRLREADENRRHFINTAAHELGTPLTPMKLQVSLLRHAGRGEADRDRSIDVLERNVDRIILLVNDLLDSAKLQSGRMEFRLATVDLAATAEAAVVAHRGAASEAGVELILDAKGQCPVEADRVRIEQVLDNLLNNAIKFTPAGGHVTVRLRKRGHNAILEVQDTGVGVAPEDMPRLFQAFSQLGQPVRGVQAGTGLGLFICKGIVETAGGVMDARSDGIGQGTTFRVVLPAGA